MSILNTLFKRRQQPLSYGNYNVTIVTERKLSKRQKGIIIKVVKKGIASEKAFRDIAIDVSRQSGTFDAVSMRQIGNDVEVII